MVFKLVMAVTLREIPFLLHAAMESYRATLCQLDIEPQLRHITSMGPSKMGMVELSDLLCLEPHVSRVPHPKQVRRKWEESCYPPIPI
jgi:hypothetical protein